MGSRRCHAAPAMLAILAVVLCVCASFQRGGAPVAVSLPRRPYNVQEKLWQQRPVLRRTVTQRCDQGGSPGRASAPRIPENAEVTADQAFKAVLRAVNDGKKRQRIELLLPLIGATDLDDWPGGIRQQFKAAQPMVEQVLQGLRRELRITQSLTGKILDQGDATAAWFNDKMTAVLFPTAETIAYIEEAVAKGDEHLVVLINPQWNKGGANFVSDFGWGQKKAKAEDLIKSFDTTYSFEQRKQSGANIKLFRSYPEEWKVLVTDDDKSFDVIGTTGDERPTYQAVEQMLKVAYPDEDILSRFMREIKEKGISGMQ